MDKNKLNDIGYRLGATLVFTIVICAIIIVIGLTAKFMAWFNLR